MRLERRNQMAAKKHPKQFKWSCLSCSSNVKPEMPRLHSGGAIDRPKLTKTLEILGAMLAVFRRKYVKPQSMATSKHDFWKLFFNPANQKLVEFLMNSKNSPKTHSEKPHMPTLNNSCTWNFHSTWKKSKNRDQLGIGTYEQIVPHFENEFLAERF